MFGNMMLRNWTKVTGAAGLLIWAASSLAVGVGSGVACGDGVCSGLCRFAAVVVSFAGVTSNKTAASSGVMALSWATIGLPKARLIRKEPMSNTKPFAATQHRCR